MKRVTAGERSEDAEQALEKWISCFGNPEVLVTDKNGLVSRETFIKSYRILRWSMFLPHPIIHKEMELGKWSQINQSRISTPKDGNYASLCSKIRTG